MVLTFGLAFAYFVGARRNKKISRVIFRILEEVLQPSKKSYTNIGGLIGYNFNYAGLKAKKVSAINGVLTMLPRQSPLYLPIAKLLGRCDKMFMTIFATNVEPRGRWHIVHSKCSQTIDVDELAYQKVSVGGQSFSLFCENQADFATLEKYLNQTQPKFLRHMAYHPEDKTFGMYWLPGNFYQDFSKSYAFILEWLN